eukprot:Nk52_evm59s1444 gene=Nk52_evmTU59s1444
MSWLQDLAGKAEALLEQADSTGASLASTPARNVFADAMSFSPLNSPQTGSRDEATKKKTETVENSEKSFEISRAVGNDFALGNGNEKSGNQMGATGLQENAHSNSEWDEGLKQPTLKPSSNVGECEASSPDFKVREEPAGVPASSDVAADVSSGVDFPPAAHQTGDQQGNVLEIDEQTSIKDNRPSATDKPKSASEKVPSVPFFGGSPVVSKTPDVALTSNISKEQMQRTATTLPDKDGSFAQKENSVLKKEMKSLNEELNSVTKNLHRNKKDLEDLKKKIAEKDRIVSEKDKEIREFKATERDMLSKLSREKKTMEGFKEEIESLKKALVAKDSFIHELELNAENTISKEKAKLGAHSTELQEAKNKIKELNASIDELTKEKARAVDDCAEARRKIEEEKAGNSDLVGGIQRELDDRIKQMDELKRNLRRAQGENEGLKKEFNEYKQRSTRVLKDREKVISELKTGSNVSLNRESSMGEDSGEFEAIRVENERLKRKLDEHNSSVHEMSIEIERLRNDRDMEEEDTTQQIDELEGEVRKGKNLIVQLQTEVESKNREAMGLKEDVNNVKELMRNEIETKDGQIEKLRKQLLLKETSSKSSFDLEAKVRDLTEQILQKQTQIEHISKAKTSLQLQLETEREKFNIRLQELKTANADDSVIFMGDGQEDNQAQMQSISSIYSGTGYGNNRNVREVVNGLDKFSIRVGVFLRRNPMARLFVIGYGVLLHFWVIFVLITYRPELHDDHIEAIGPGNE